VLQMERLDPLIGRWIHLISPSASDAHVDEEKEIDVYCDEIEQLRKALLSSLMVGINTQGASLEEILSSQKHGWLRMAIFSADGKNIDVNEATAILSLYLFLPKAAHKSFENAWGKAKKAMVKRCDTHLSNLQGVRDFLQIKMIPHVSVLADDFLSTWMIITTKKGKKAVGNFIESKSSRSTAEGWLRFALFGKDMKDPFESNEETAVLFTYLASKHVPTEAIDFAWGIVADARESLFQTTLATTDSMLDLFKMRTSTLSNRLPSPEALVQKALLSYLILVSSTQGTSFEEILSSQRDGWLRMAIFSSNGNIHASHERTVILSLYLFLPKTAHKSFENAWKKAKRTLVKRCELFNLEDVRDFLQVKIIPHISALADDFLSTWMGIMTKKGERAVGNFLESKSGPSETEGWLRFALFGKGMKDPFESNEETAILFTYLASKHTRIEAIDFAWGILADARESLFQTTLATTDSMHELFKMPTSTLSNRLPSPETLVPSSVSLHSTLKDPPSSIPVV
jgi:hypothetical protein